MFARGSRNVISNRDRILECSCPCLWNREKSAWNKFLTGLKERQEGLNDLEKLQKEGKGASKGRRGKSKRQRRVRKPFITDVNELKRRARLEKWTRREVHEIPLKPPDNGLLVKKLIPVAYEVYAARNLLSNCVSRIIESVPVHVCRVCGEVHVGLLPHKIRSCNVAGSLPTKEHVWVKGGTENILLPVESFHLYDRVGRAVSHAERLEVDRIPAVVELCLQAGLDLPEYPTRRRTSPVYSISGRIIDFEKRFPRDVIYGDDIEAFGFWQRPEKTEDIQPQVLSNHSQELAVQGMELWEKMRSGASRLMEKYPVQTCGHCPEVQVGPKGHRVRLCQAFKHQMRDGQHAWQEASIDDVVPPVFVWHVRDPHSSEPLVHALRGYYGKLPAAVELFWQAGAQIGKEYADFMKEDVVIPEVSEEKLVV